MNLFEENLRKMIEITCFGHFFSHSDRKTWDILVFMVKNRVNKADFFKLSTGEIPVLSGPVDFPNRSGPVRYRNRTTGPVPALNRGEYSLEKISR